MILLTAPREATAAALAARLSLKRRYGYAPYLAGDGELYAAALGDQPLRALGNLGLLLGALSRETARSGEYIKSRQIALLLLAEDPAADSFVYAGDPVGEGEPAGSDSLLALKVSAGDGGEAYYPDPLLLTGLPLGEIRSHYLATLLAWAVTVVPTDLLYPIYLAGAEEAASLEEVTAYVTTLGEMIPEEPEPLTGNDEALLGQISRNLHLSQAGRAKLFREVRRHLLRRGELPEELYGYGALSVRNRREGERLLTSMIELLREDDRG